MVPGDFWGDHEDRCTARYIDFDMLHVDLNVWLIFDKVPFFSAGFTTTSNVITFEII